MTFGFLGGLAAGYQGFQKGSDDELARQQLAADKIQLEKDRTYQQTQREYNQGQQSRTIREQGITDSIQDEQKAVSPTREMEINPGQTEAMPQLDDEGTPSAAALPATRSVPRANWEMARDYSNISRKKGRIAEADKYQEAYEKGGALHSAKLFAQIEASAGSMTPFQMVQAAAKVYSDDPYGGQIENPQQAEDGSVSFTVSNKQTGQSVNKTFKNAGQVLDDLRGYYSPEAQAKVQELRRASLLKQQEENNKVHVVAAGGMAMRNDGTVLANNDTGYIQDGTNEDGTPRYIKPARAGAGAAGGKAKLGPASKTIEDGMKNTPELIPLAMQHRDALYANNPGMTEALADSLGVRMATSNGQGVTTKFDPRTGLFNSVLQDFPQQGKDGKPSGYATGKTYLLGSNSFTPGGGIPKEEAAKAAAEVANSSDPQVLQGYLATKTPDGYKAYQTSLNRAGQEALAKAKADLSVAKTPAEQANVQAGFQEFKGKLESEARRMELIRGYYTAPTAKPVAAPAPEKSPLANVGGLFGGGYTPPANSVAGRAQVARQQAQQVQQVKTAETQAGDAVKRARITTDIKAAMQMQDPTQRLRVLGELQQSPEFGLLDPATKSAVFSSVNGR